MLCHQGTHITEKTKEVLPSGDEQMSAQPLPGHPLAVSLDLSLDLSLPSTFLKPHSATTELLTFSIWSIFWKTLLDAQCLYFDPHPQLKHSPGNPLFVVDTFGAYFCPFFFSHPRGQCTKSNRHCEVSCQASEQRVIVKVGRGGLRASHLRKATSARCASSGSHFMLLIPFLSKLEVDSM